MLDAIDTSGLATKADVSAIRADLERFATKADLELFEARVDVRLERELRAIESRFVTWLLASQAVVVAAIVLATTALIAVLG